MSNHHNNIVIITSVTHCGGVTQRSDLTPQGLGSITCRLNSRPTDQGDLLYLQTTTNDSIKTISLGVVERGTPWTTTIEGNAFNIITEDITYTYDVSCNLLTVGCS